MCVTAAPNALEIDSARVARAYGRTYSTESRPATRAPEDRGAPILDAVAVAVGNGGARGCHSSRRTNAEMPRIDASPQGAPDATLGTTPGAPIDQTHEPRTS
jgi:hypothetical protein